MTLEEAKAILSKCGAWIGDGYENDILLDGNFTLEQLEALVLVIKTEGIDFSLGDS